MASKLLWRSRYRVFGGTLTIYWSVARWCARAWRHRRTLPLIRPWLQHDYDIERDDWRFGVYLGLVEWWKD